MLAITDLCAGWQPRWFVLDSGILSYYLSPEEVKSGSRGAFKVSSCNIRSESREYQEDGQSRCL